MTAALHTRLRYPNDELLTQLPELLHKAGLDLVEDEHRRFALPIHDQADAERLVESLYLPDVDDATRERAVAVAASGGIGLSLRRIVTLRRELAVLAAASNIWHCAGKLAGRRKPGEEN